ncbi:hypothetical protein NHX12_027839 [Muraenolepis orangiensis]|uniref:MH1 domain-containing protein n=1 Tax=Muraenolepis orangiensis TaxID=630683 RepID=A0A9Q0EI25_9TELE|nr:hypothetical protein NHX12_027839 [Muraenolepis orangiensis]
MFRTKRSGLVRRLWRSRAPGAEEGEAGRDRGGTHGGGSTTTTGGGCCMGKTATKVVVGSKEEVEEEAELKALTHSVLKRLKEKQLELLLQAVESKGGAPRSPCLLLPGTMDTKVGQRPCRLLAPLAALQSVPVAGPPASPFLRPQEAPVL